MAMSINLFMSTSLFRQALGSSFAFRKWVIKTQSYVLGFFHQWWISGRLWDWGSVWRGYGDSPRQPTPTRCGTLLWCCSCERAVPPLCGHLPQMLFCRGHDQKDIQDRRNNERLPNLFGKLQGLCYSSLQSLFIIWSRWLKILNTRLNFHTD